jgi:hypothetical protein
MELPTVNESESLAEPTVNESENLVEPTVNGNQDLDLANGSYQTTRSQSIK